MQPALELKEVQLQETSKRKKKIEVRYWETNWVISLWIFFFQHTQIDWIQVELQESILNNAADRAQHKAHSVCCASWIACIISMDREVKQWCFSSKTDFLHPFSFT